MKTETRLLLGTAAIALAGCSQLPGSSLGATFGAERYLKADHGGPGFEGALASEYTEVARRAAFQDVRWRNSTAYIAKAKQAEAGSAPAPWSPDQLGVNGDAADMYQNVVAMINDNKAERPEACARAQVMWDQYLEALRGGDKNCITPADARAFTIRRIHSRIVHEGSRGKQSIVEHCRREGIVTILYFKQFKEFLEVGKKLLRAIRRAGRRLASPRNCSPRQPP